MTDNQLLRLHGLDLLCLNCEHAYDIRSTPNGFPFAPPFSPGRATLGFCCEIADVMKRGKEQHILLHQIRTECINYVQKEEKEAAE